jgi:hypothetical protein
MLDGQAFKEAPNHAPFGRARDARGIERRDFGGIVESKVRRFEARAASQHNGGGKDAAEQQKRQDRTQAILDGWGLHAAILRPALDRHKYGWCKGLEA